MSRYLSLGLLGAGLAGALACGGGGGAEAPISVTFAPAVLESTFRNGEVVTHQTVRATFSRLPSSPVVLVLMEDQPVLADDGITMQTYGDTRVDLTLFPSTDLPAGDHTGTFRIRFYKDAKTYDDILGELPYRFTVTQGRLIRAVLDGQPQAATATKVHALNASLDPNGTSQGERRHLVELTSVTPVTWVVSIPDTVGDPVVTVLESTPTSWRGYVADNGPGGYPKGYIAGWVRIYALDGSETYSDDCPIVSLILQVPYV